MLTASRASLRLASITIGLLFTAAIYHTMHNNPRWDWSAPGVGKLPREIVGDFMHQAYDLGRGATASRDYFSAKAKDNAPAAQDRLDGAPMAHEVRSIIAQGMTVVVVHRIAAARGEPQSDVIDVFHMKDGRIDRRDRYPTRFDQ